MNYFELNNQVMQRDENGYLQFEKDKEATRAYFLENVNKKLMLFGSLREKLDYLFENNYYDKSIFDKYDFKDVKTLYKFIYSKKFRFTSFMSAYKFYNDYALNTDDGTQILERYEDRVAVNALFFGEGDFDKAMSVANILITQQYQPATPTFLNVGRARRGELVSCFIMQVNDSLNDINMASSTAKQLSKIGGGVSLNLSNIRAKGESIKDIEGKAKGVVGVMKVLDHGFRYADQMGQRQGAGAAYLNIFHADINDFLDTKKISADEDIRVKTLSIGVVIPDKFIQLARENKPAYVFYPHTVYKATGKHFTEIDFTEMYDELVANPAVRKDEINARALLEKIAVLRFESGYPFLMFRDNVNQAHALEGDIDESNLCTEILQKIDLSTYTDYGEPDVIGRDVSCNLGSINIKNAMEHKDIGNVVALATDALTVVSNVTEIKNAPAVARANKEMRSIGLGVMNLHGYLASVGIAYESKQAIELADVFFAAVNYYSIKRSNELAQETGSVFSGFNESKYFDGSYFKDYISKEYLPQSEKITELFEGIQLPTRKDWEELAKSVATHGLYHSYRLAIAPTGSISYVQSATASIMPIMDRIEERTYGNSKTYYPMPGLSTKTWFFYKEAYDMDMFKVVDLVATIQRHVDQGISFTLFLTDTMTTRDLTRIDLYAHHKGIKTIYYARTKDTTADACLSCQV